MYRSLIKRINHYRHTRLPKTVRFWIAALHSALDVLAHVVFLNLKLSGADDVLEPEPRARPCAVAEQHARQGQGIGAGHVDQLHVGDGHSGLSGTLVNEWVQEATASPLGTCNKLIKRGCIIGHRRRNS